MALYSIPSIIEIKNTSEEVVKERKLFTKELEERKQLVNKLIEKYSDIHPPSHRILVVVDEKYKDRVALGNSGVTLERPRNYDDLNHRITQPSQGIVINSIQVSRGASILFNHNSAHETNKLFTLEYEIDIQGINVYSIPKEECYVYKEIGSDEWKPCEGFLLGLKVFEPYKGIIEGIEPKEIKRAFYVTSDGYLKGEVVNTLHASLYPIVFNDENYNEKIIIRVRHFPNDPFNPREEVIGIDEGMTKKVLNGELLIGNNKNDCKKIFLWKSKMLSNVSNNINL